MNANELTDDEIDEVFCEVFCFDKGSKPTSLGYEFCRAILRKAQEKTTESVMSEHCTCYKLGYSPLNNYAKVANENN